MLLYKVCFLVLEFLFFPSASKSLDSLISLLSISSDISLPDFDPSSLTKIFLLISANFSDSSTCTKATGFSPL